MRGLLHRTISPEGIQILAAYYGPGTPLRVPDTTANAKHIEILIGIPETAALVREFGGTAVYLPGVPKRQRSPGEAHPPSIEQVAILSRQKRTAREIARQFGCTVRTIYSKRAAWKKEQSNEREAEPKRRRI